MSLAEELMADIEFGVDEMVNCDGFNDAVEEVMNVDEIKEEKTGHDFHEKRSQTVHSLAKLMGSEKLDEVMKGIESYSNVKREKSVFNSVAEAEEYQLIIKANEVAVEIENEINIIHKFVRDIYSKRFPELDSIILSPTEYIQAVRVLGNDILERSKHTELLSSFLTPASIMVVSVTASTTQGAPLDVTKDLTRIDAACQMAHELLECKQAILRYVESRMTFIAPNLTILLGSSVAAKLMGTAGGLNQLSKIPACNLQHLGQKRRTMGGLSHLGAQSRTTSHIYQCDLVQKLPPDFRTKAVKIVSAKASLASRIDANREGNDGGVGDQLLTELEKKIDKWLEPPPVKKIKALPAPIEPPSKKRGGRRYRKMKERLGLTDLRKAANRLSFGSIADDAYQSDIASSTGGGGVLGGKNFSPTGRIRGPVVDAKTKARISKSLAAKIHRQDQVHQQTYGGSTTVKRAVAGTASSVAFTPLQGLEIVNPQAAEKKSEDSNRYFSSTAGFFKVKKAEK